MNKQQEALRLALEALENWWEFDPENWGDTDNKAITAIREALAEQCVCGDPDTPGTHRTDGPCLAEQHEPVAWMYVNSDGECEQIEYIEFEAMPDDPSITPLYTKDQL